LFVAGSPQIYCDVNLGYNPVTLEENRGCPVMVKDFAMPPGPVISLASLWQISFCFFALGCQNGEVLLFKFTTEPINKETVQRLSLDGPVAALLLIESESEGADLLVLGAVGHCMVYRDVAQDLGERKVFINTPTSETLTCAAAVDVDFDGQKEILIGSYSKEMFRYKQRRCKRSDRYHYVWSLNLCAEP
jgi:hypothetical protein